MSGMRVAPPPSSMIERSFGLGRELEEQRMSLEFKCTKRLKLSGSLLKQGQQSLRDGELAGYLHMCPGAHVTSRNG